MFDNFFFMKRYQKEVLIHGCFCEMSFRTAGFGMFDLDSHATIVLSLPNYRKARNRMVDMMKMSSDDLAKLRSSQDIEHDLWTSFVHEWEKVFPESMNDSKYDPLIESIKDWGDGLVALRRREAQIEADQLSRAALERFERSVSGS